MKDLIILLGLLVSLLGTCVYGGFYFGRRYEATQIQKYLPKAMDGVCSDCNDLGRKEGYKAGLKTCDDLVDAMNDGRR